MTHDPVASDAQWPPEVPPFRPPGPPTEPPAPRPAPEPVPILPSWEEPDPLLAERDLTDRLLEQRVVVVVGKLDEALANHVAAQLLLLDRRGPEEIELHLSCSQSELEASLALAGAVEMVSAPVNVTVRGTVRGPAVAVLCAGRRRVAHRHALLVLSVPHAAAEGTPDQVVGLAEQHAHQLTQLRRQIAARTGHLDEDIDRDLTSGRMLTATEAVEYGLVDEVR